MPEEVRRQKWVNFESKQQSRWLSLSELTVEVALQTIKNAKKRIKSDSVHLKPSLPFRLPSETRDE